MPAWQPQMVISECQWFGVATEIASRFWSSRARRMSWTVLGVLPPLFAIVLMCFAYVVVSGSIR